MVDDRYGKTKIDKRMKKTNDFRDSSVRVTDQVNGLVRDEVVGYRRPVGSRLCACGDF